MKTILTAFILLLLFTLPNAIQAQKFVVKSSPLKLLLRTPSITGEYVLNDRQSLALHTRYSFYSIGKKDGNGRATCRGFGFTPEMRFYLIPSQSAPNGFYAAPYVLMNFYKLTLTIENEHGRGFGAAKANMIGGGGIIGYQYITKNNVAIDGFLGLGFQVASVGKVKVAYEDNFEEERSTGLKIAGLLPRFGFSVGYAFGG